MPTRQFEFESIADRAKLLRRIEIFDKLTEVDGDVQGASRRVQSPKVQHFREPDVINIEEPSGVILGC